MLVLLFLPLPSVSDIFCGPGTDQALASAIKKLNDIKIVCDALNSQSWMESILRAVSSLVCVWHVVADLRLLSEWIHEWASELF